MFVDDTTYAPLRLFEYDHDPGTYCLTLADTDFVAVMDVFEASGRYGNGPGWTDLALQAMRTEAPEIEQHMEFDPEAGTFVAFGSDLDALKRLGVLLHAACHDHARLAKLAANAPYEYD